MVECSRNEIVLGSRLGALGRGGGVWEREDIELTPDW